MNRRCHPRQVGAEQVGPHPVLCVPLRTLPSLAARLCHDKQSLKIIDFSTEVGGTSRQKDLYVDLPFGDSDARRMKTERVHGNLIAPISQGSKGRTGPDEIQPRGHWGGSAPLRARKKGKI